MAAGNPQEQECTIPQGGSVQVAVVVSPGRLEHALPPPEAGHATTKVPVFTPVPQVTEQLPYEKFPSQFTTGTFTVHR